ncbi:MAG: class I tRNA ligase family protein, partial [Candidatus Magasanikiibacteriota bacterium]
TDHPVMEKWLEELLPLVKDFDENDVIIGHSIGGSTALHLLEQMENKIGHLYLVAPAVGELADEEIKKKKAKKPEKDYDMVRAFWEMPIIWNKILKKVNQANVLYSNTDESIKSYGHELWPNDWQIKFLGNHGHFVDKEYDVLFENFVTAKNTGWIPLPESELPLELPKVEKYEPTDNGESPLAVMTDWVNTKCPVCGGEARRETDTMPNWAGSSWYYLAYTMMKEKNGEYVWDRAKMDYWNPVDWYNGGMEHTVLHLLYSRFWNEFLFDIGLVPTSEPYKKRTSHGMILAADGEKMSKSRGNVINPDEMVEKFGTDAFRTYIMFMGPFDQAVAWDTNGVVGVRRFLEKVWSIFDFISVRNKHFGKGEWWPSEQTDKKLAKLLEKTIKKVGEDVEKLSFNTAISQLMIFVNGYIGDVTDSFGSLNDQIQKIKEESVSNPSLANNTVISKFDFERFIKLLSLFAPHIADEIWERLGNKGSVSQQTWPEYDPALIIDDVITVVAQVNGKVRDEFQVPVDISEEEIKTMALASDKVQKWLEGKEPKKVIYVKGRLVSIVV